MMQTQTLDNNGNYVTLLVESEKQYLPAYLTSFFAEYNRDSGGLFHVLRAVRKRPEPKDNGKHYFYLVFTLDVPLSPADFETYIYAIVDNDITPFLCGSKIMPCQIEFSYAIPDSCKSIAKAGELDVSIYCNELSPHILQVMQEVFCMTEEQIDYAGEMIGMIGQFKVYKCLPEVNKTKLEFIMKKMSIKYELE